jgi:ABC-type transport system substrate-binding protein
MSSRDLISWFRAQVENQDNPVSHPSLQPKENNMKMKRLFLLAAALVLAILTLASCGPAAATAVPTSTVAPTATPAPTATQIPTITPTIPAEPTKPPIDPASNFPTGKLVLREDELSYFIFTNDGRWGRYLEGLRIGSGTFRVEGNTYILTSFHGPEPCPVPMSYQFSFDGTNLTFNLTDESKKDSCSGRRQNYNNTTWVLSK